MLAIGQILKLDQTGVQPVLVRVLGGQRRLDLVVADDAAMLGVDEEHTAWLQPALSNDTTRLEVKDARLGSEDHQAVVGDPVATGPQAVAVQHRPDDVAVGERDAGRPVPRLHEAGVELVERLAGGVHLLVVLPRLGDHHQDRVRQRPTAQVQQLQDLVERRRVGGAVAADRKEAFKVARDHLTGKLALACPHPVAIALKGVDLAVVGDQPVGVGQRPRGEGVCREARVDQGQLGGEAAVRQVGEEQLELTSGEHALVDHGAR